MADEPPKVPDEVATLLMSLGENEREILLLRFGLDRGEPRTLDEVGEQLRLTRAEVQAVEERALEKLKGLDSG